MIRRGNSKGLSTIVATLLIILLVLVAVGIIWVVVKNVIQTNSEKVSLGQFTVDLKISQVQITNDSSLNVTVKRNTGDGDFVGINFIIDDGRNTEIIKKNISMQELETRKFQLYLVSANASEIRTISIVPIFRLESGKEVVGEMKDTYNFGSSGVGVCDDSCSILGYTCGIRNICDANINCGNCSTGYVCSGASCVLQSTCTDSCSSLGYNCGTQTVCGNNINCGNCSTGQTCIGGVCTSPTTDWQTGMVSWWKLDGSVNDSLGANNGTLYGSALISNNCKSGQCYNFDGINDYIKIIHNSFGVNAPFTMSCWIKTSATQAYSAGIISLGYSPVTVLRTDGRISSWWSNGTIYPSLISTSSYTDGNWHLISTTFNGTTITLYIDGVSVRSSNQPVYSIYSDFYIGQEHNSGVKYFNGSIDEAMIWDRGLSASEIQQIYNYNYVSPTPTCSDGIQNQGETGIDCGGPCSACIEQINYYGTPFGPDSLQNFDVGNTGDYEASYRFRAKYSGYISQARFYLIYKLTGYGKGDGGEIKITLETDDGTANHFPSGIVLASVIDSDPMSDGGNSYQHLYTFDSPALVTAGNIYHIHFSNIAADAHDNYIGMDGLITLDGNSYADLAPTSNITELAVLGKSNTEGWSIWDYYPSIPVFTVYYLSGDRQGQGYLGAQISYTHDINGINYKIRNNITVSGSSRIVNKINIRVSKVSGTDSLTVRLEESNGTLIEEGTISAANFDNLYKWGSLTFAIPHTLLLGSTYYVVLSTENGTTYKTFPLQDGGYGYDYVYMFPDGFFEYTTDGTTWKMPSRSYKAQMYFETI